MDNKSFALIGASGYIAPRHLKAIKDTGNKLVAALDPFDSVGIMDSFFPDADFFTEPERFDRHLDKLRRKGDGNKINFVSICSPNYLHDAHIRMALRNEADAICEKPIVLNPWNIDALQEIEKEAGKKIFTIFQLRLHPSIITLKKQVEHASKQKKFDVDLSYITSRGNWYHNSWKGDKQKSGGIATNIGVHFFDMLSYLFGDLIDNIVHFQDNYKAAGFLEYKMARVRWFLSVDFNDIPLKIKTKGLRTYRSIIIGGNEVEFSGGFTNLHTESYKKIMLNEGFNLEDARSSINTVFQIRNAKSIGIKGDYHPLLKQSIKL